MPQYYSQGKIPHKRHTQFRKPDGGLYAEELFSTHGFSNMYSLIYHCHPPTMIKSAGEPFSREPEIAMKRSLLHQSFQGFNVQPEDDYIKSKKPVLVNNDLQIALAAPRKSTKDYFLKNADADELIFVHEGSGTFHSIYGSMDFGYGDYIVIPRGTIFQLHFNTENNRLLVVDSFSAIQTPRRYRNEYGQFEEHSPFCERDFRRPQNLKTFDEKGEFLVMIKKESIVYPFVYATHPFDAIGWDGYCYPYIFSIHDFEPITGRIHLPPPIHQTFEAHNFVVCSFVPRLFDYHPLSIPVPYNHSNIDSDEMLYYVDGDFMSRKNVTKGQITLHPAGIPHGPHPGTVEKSLGAKETKELAVMIDTFKPLWLTKEAMNIIIPDYYKSWVENG
ncbi:MAG TPA: homogentisate 1,2-dioxygenase [Bacteroidia bacterium]|nr:homogentisate 1,2-dioxygenase [Bacteroidia bacterium]QQR94335.1 MAG: homogentisate 1,2-dioxygenase [Bacteroidota bacterium]MBP7714629.1 homogentisate 1,2-dioxygenase [Bacteroidia bacterium]MBP8669310.1 homogentisate 1,2-dioxygenase [Bacteroidia bacterium]HQW16974.1 homogentisate 1,2-dioxygenase [Bacteroidia bacterium]